MTLSGSTPACPCSKLYISLTVRIFFECVNVIHHVRRLFSSSLYVSEDLIGFPPSSPYVPGALSGFSPLSVSVTVAPICSYVTEALIGFVYNYVTEALIGLCL